MYSQLKKNPHTSLKNQVFYRQDYLDEFEKIWETQAAFHDILQPELKKEIRDIIIFYQRKLKSQKGQLALCQLENWEQKFINKETKKEQTRTIGRKVIPKSSPLFQQFKIWQNLNNVEYTNEELNQKIIVKELDEEIRKVLFEELNLRGKLSKSELLKLIGKHMKLGKLSLWSCNFDEIEGNRTNQKILDVLQSITAMEGYAIDWKKQPASKIIEELKITLPQIGIDPAILTFDPYNEGWNDQPSYRLWHLLYATEEDDKISNKDREIYGINAVAVKKALHLGYNFSPTYARMMASVIFPKDYGNLSAKAIRKILPFLEDGQNYADACRAAGYNHSNSLTKEELSKRILKDKLELLPKNSLRNPVVEKILNQMVNVVNQVIETYGKPDEIRIELARELKKSAKERATMTKGIADAIKRNDDIRKYITKTFGIPNPTKNDIIRYRLYQELESNGHKDIFTNTYISKDILFSKSIDIEHILPKALVYDDSFSNKTLAFRKDNLKKKDRTAIDFIANDYAAELNNYKSRVEQLYKEGSITKAKQIKLLRPATEIPDGFIDRDLRNSQYIARKAKSLLFGVFKEVTATTGNITDRLRADWGIINVMKELNLPKYRSAGLTTFEERLDIGEGKIKKYEVIQDWSKRNDHRHHAMDALTVAFTTHNHIQYINNYNARRDTSLDHHPIIKNIEKLITEKKEKGKSGNYNRVFIAPMSSFREKAKKQLEEVLISFKNKNKVVTWNVNTIKAPDGKNHHKRQQTPRDQLHKETVYGKSKRPLEKKIKLKKNFGLDQIQLIVDPKIRAVVNNHLTRYNNDPEIAFSASTLKKDPLIYLNETFNEVHCFEEIFTIRKDINPDNFKTEKLINKVVDLKIRAILKERFKEYGENPKVAFSDLESNPIYLNKGKGITIKRVSITGVSNAEALHTAKDHLGNEIKDKQGKAIPVDYVSTGNNHHVAIYEDEKGNLQEEVVSFFEAVTRKNNGFSVVQKNHAKGWKFLFTMKQNEMFIIPSEDFDPKRYDLLDPANYTAISKRLFRVQKIASKNFMFRHHLETELIDAKELRGISWELFQSLSYLKDLIKVRINHIGQVVQIGEY